MRLDDVARVGLERDLGFVARLDLMQLVLGVEGVDLVVWYSTNVITSFSGMPATKAPGRSCTLTGKPVGRRARARSADNSHCALSSFARVVSSCACDTPSCARAVATCAFTAAIDARSPPTCPANSSRTACWLARAVASCAVSSFTSCFALLEVEPAAGAGRGQFPVLRQALACQLQ